MKRLSVYLIILFLVLVVGAELSGILDQYQPLKSIIGEGILGGAVALVVLMPLAIITWIWSRFRKNGGEHKKVEPPNIQSQPEIPIHPRIANTSSEQLAESASQNIVNNPVTSNNIKSYEIITKGELRELEREVEKKIALGYRPLGGPFTSDHDLQKWFCQAVIRN